MTVKSAVRRLHPEKEHLHIMARIALRIADPAQRITLEMMLRAEGHDITDECPKVTITDTPADAIKAAAKAKTLLLTAASGIPDAVEAMKQGVFGYIFLPLQPGEAPLMIARALAHSAETANSMPPPQRTLEMIEKEYILRVLHACKGNQAKAARWLDIGRNTLWRKLNAYREEDAQSPERELP